MYNYKTSGFNNFLTRAKPRQTFDNVNLADFMQAGSVPFSSLYLESGQIAGKINASEITSAMLVDLSVLNAKLADAAVTAEKMANLAITEAKIAANAVTAGKTSIAAINATTGDLNSNAVGSSQIQTNAVTEAKVLADAITAAKIAVSGLDGITGDVATNHIAAGMIQTNAVTSVKVLADAITATKINVAALNGATGNLNSGTVDTTQLVNDAVTSLKVLDDAVTAAKVNVSGLDGTSGNVAADHIVANMLQTDCVTTAKILAGAVTTNEIAANTIVAGNIAATTITASELATNCVTSVKILADAVTASKINVVGLDGSTGRIVVADATDANVVTGGINSHAATLIQAGKIVISGAVNLDDWSSASDATYIDGGKIYASSITASQIAATTITASELAANCVTTIKLNAGAVTANKLTTYNFILSAGSLTDNSPGAGSVAWSSCKVVYNGTEHTITNGNTANKFIYWQSASPTVFATSASLPSLGNDDFIVAENLSGTHLLVWNSTIVDGGRVKTGSVTATQIQASTITANEIAAATITGTQIAADAITAPKINVVGLDGTTGRIVVTDETDANVVTGGINSHATTLIQAGKIIISGATHLDDWRNATDVTKIDGGKIYASSITASQIAAGTITANEIVANTITANEIANLAITNSKVNDLDAGKLNTGTLNADRIAASSIVAGKLNVSTLSAISANIGAITSGSIDVTGTVTAGTCKVGAVAGHSGISLNGTTDYNNIFFKRDSDGIVFFRLNQGGAHSIMYNSSSGVLSIRGTLNADDIDAGTITGRTLKANGGAGIDVWVENDGVIRFRSGGSTRSYIQALGDNSIRFDADNNIQLRADSVDVYYEMDNDGSDAHWRAYNSNMKMKLTSGGQLQVEDDVVEYAGIDFAELFENKVKKIIPYGISVVLENEKIRPAKEGEIPIGIVSSTPGFVCAGGESDAGENWQGKYLKDEWGKKITEKAEFWRYKTYKGKDKRDYIKKSGWSDEKKPPEGAVKKIQEREKINPDWDKTKKYIPRMERLKEWSIVGLLGRIRMLKGQPTNPHWIKLRNINDKVEEWLVK